MATVDEYKEYQQASDRFIYLKQRRFLACMTAEAPPLSSYRDSSIDIKLAAAGADEFVKVSGGELQMRPAGRKKTPTAIHFIKACRYVIHQLKYLTDKGLNIPTLHQQYEAVLLNAITASLHEPDDNTGRSLAALVTAVNACHHSGVDICA